MEADSAFPPSLAIALHQESNHNAEHVDDVARLELIVAKMRELGVVKYDGIELGPEPTAEQDEDKVNEQRVTLEKRETERRERLRFAASGGPRLGDRRVR